MKIVTKNQEEPRKRKLGNNSKMRKIKPNPSGTRKKESRNEILFSRQIR